MRRRGRGLIAALIGTLIILGAVVFAALWWNGLFLPSWIKWNERTEASDGAGTGEVASIVLKERDLIAYNRGEEVYRTPGSWRVQDVIWQDINFDGEREIVALYWSHDKDGAESALLTGEGSFGLKQHIAVYDGVTRGMNMIWQSAPLATRVASFRMNEAGYIVINEPELRQTAWVWTGDAVVASNAATPMQSAITVQTDDAAHGASDPQGTETATPPDAAPVTQPSGNSADPGTGTTGDSASAPSGSSVSFLAVGDDLVHENVWRTGVSNGGDYSYLFENIIPMINSVDFACYNQETMFVEESAGYSGYPMFGSPIGIGEAAIRAGFDIVTCSTNHSLDKGTYGIETTADFFESHKAEITYLGIYTRDKWNEPEHEIKTVSKNGITFALLNFTYGLNGIPVPADAPYCVDTNLHDLSNYSEATVAADEERMRSYIRRAKEISDVVIFFPHWGQEYVYEPVNNPHNAYDQVYWTNVMLEEGVDIVVGTHPHVVEPVEMLVREDGHEMLVYYSLGNYVSGQNEMPRVVGGMATFTVTKKGDRCFVSAYDMLPIVTHQEGGGVTTAYMMDEYTDELASRHVLGVNVESMRNLYRNIIDWKAQ